MNNDELRNIIAKELDKKIAYLIWVATFAAISYQFGYGFFVGTFIGVVVAGVMVKE